MARIIMLIIIMIEIGMVSDHLGEGEVLFEVGAAGVTVDGGDLGDGSGEVGDDLGFGLGLELGVLGRGEI